jgi:hypothetical protein
LRVLAVNVTRSDDLGRVASVVLKIRNFDRRPIGVQHHGLVAGLREMAAEFPQQLRLGVEPSGCLIEPQQLNGNAAAPKYANRKSDATMAAMRATTSGDACRSTRSSNTSDILLTLALLLRKSGVALIGSIAGRLAAVGPHLMNAHHFTILNPRMMSVTLMTDCNGRYPTKCLWPT